MNKQRAEDPDRVAALQTAVETYRAAVAQADPDLIDALEAARAARVGPPLTWRTIGECFGTTHQSVISRWRTISKNRIPSIPSIPTADNTVPSTEQTASTIVRPTGESRLVSYLFDRTES